MRFFTAGESHGPGLTVIVEGLPAGLSVSEESINLHLERRQRGYGRGGRMAIERDRVCIRGGVRHGKTLGSPVAMWIENRDFANWKDAMAVAPVSEETDRVEETRVVPGHADFPGALKYLAHDLRNILERASARETTARVAAGALAIVYLAQFGMQIRSRVVSIGDVEVPSRDDTEVNWDLIEQSDVRAVGEETAARLRQAIDNAKNKKVSVGGVMQIVAFGVPVGLGSHVHWDRKLDGRLAQSLMSINAVKGVEIGPAFANTLRSGRDVQDIVVPDDEDTRRFRRLSNRAGGLEGGISNGEPIVVYAAVKPIATMENPLPSVDINTGEIVDAPYHRSDSCQVVPACIVGEAMVALTLADAIQEKFGGDHIEETQRNFDAYITSHRSFGRGATD